MTPRPRRRDSRPPPGGEPSRHGFTLIEILIATFVLAFAMIPVFGLMTRGAVRTDLNAGYTNAVELASGVMNQLLSEQTTFASLPDSGGVAAYPAPRSELAEAGGNVAADPALDPLFPAPQWTTTAEGTRTIEINGTQFHVQLWIGRYGAANAPIFGYYRSPVIDFRSGADPRQFDCVKTIDQAAYTNGFSPYAPSSLIDQTANPLSRVSTGAWAQPASEVVETVAEYAEDAQPINLAKIVLRVSWGYRGRRMRGSSKEFYLMTLKADLQE